LLSAVPPAASPATLAIVVPRNRRRSMTPSQARSVAGRAAVVAEGGAGGVHEPPAVAAPQEGEPQDPEGAGHADPAVGRHRAERQPRGAAGADHQLADAVDGVVAAERVLRGEALVVVVVAVEHQVGVGGGWARAVAR